MPTPEVLFVCVHNAGRSQMAAALLEHHAAGNVRVRSADSDPAEALNPAVVAAMAEVGIDLSRKSPKPLTDASVKAADVHPLGAGCDQLARSCWMRMSMSSRMRRTTWTGWPAGSWSCQSS